MPRPGDVVHLRDCDDGGANVPWSCSPMLFRVIRIHDWTTWEGTVYLDGYELNSAGDAVERRTVYTRIDGIHLVEAKPVPLPRAPRRAVNARAAAIPRPRRPAETPTPGRTR